jgi:hypothetical protein
MSELRIYRAKAARRPLQFWLQPFLLLLLIALLWHLLPVSALLFKPRLVQPLPDPHVFYVKLNPAYAAEVLRASMQAWHRSGGGSGDNISLDAVEPFVPLGAPALLEQGSVYPGRWSPGDVTPLAQALPDLFCASGITTRFPFEPGSRKLQGVKIECDPALAEADFSFPEEEILKIPGSGSCRFFVETDDDGTVVHLLVLDGWGENSAKIGRMLDRGSSRGAARGELRVMWRNQ